MHEVLVQSGPDRYADQSVKIKGSNSLHEKKSATGFWFGAVVTSESKSR